MQQPFPSRRRAVAALFASGGAVFAAHGTASAAGEQQATPVPIVIVTGSRIEQDSFDFPAAIDIVDAARIGDTHMRVNASEALVAVPGIVVHNRENYAQDLQISSRGFGARSAFGVRGVRLFADGIPASMPDGQGQAATFNLDMAERIEVLRGPFSALYGNHSGGVIQLFTRDGSGPPALEGTFASGSDGMRKVDVNAQGESAGISYLIDASRFDTDGYRQHSAARRDQGFAKLSVRPGDTSRLTLTASTLTQDDTQDPLGVTWATFQRDPRAGEIDLTDPQSPQRTLAERYDTRKSIEHHQAGLTFEERFGQDRLLLKAWGGNRQVIQYQAFSRAFQAAPSQSGGVVDFERDFYGAELQWQFVRQLAGGTLSTTAGLEYSHSEDDRQGYENFIGNQFGVRGALRRDETNTLSNLDPYLQTQWERGPWVLGAGLRRSSLEVEVSDRFISTVNGNDSGGVEYSEWTPVLSALYKVSPRLNVYASAARGFETPTLNELFYSAGGTGFNFRLLPAISGNIELGAKAKFGDHTRVEAALFEVRTDDELVVETSGGGRTSYRNASETLRRGAEVSLDSQLGSGFSTRWALTLLRATYETPFGSVPAGSRLPGVPGATLFGELAWRDDGGRFGAALETVARSKTYVEDSNTEQPAPGHAIVNARVQARQSVDRWRFKQFVRLNNLFDRDYVGSVIVGDANRRYYEAAPRRQWMLGVSAQYTF